MKKQHLSVLREPEVARRTGLSRMQRWRLEQAREFPGRIQLGRNSVGWVEDEVESWIAARMAARDREQ